MIQALPSLSAVGMVKQGLGHMVHLSAESVKSTRANMQDKPGIRKGFFGFLARDSAASLPAQLQDF